jgi:Cu/Ag efflux protein CusF
MSYNSAPQGRPKLSPALQSWGKCEKLIKSRRDDRVSTHTKDDEVLCASDWIPLLKSETMVADNERRPNMDSPLNSSSPRLALFGLCALLAFSVACSRGPSQPGAATSQPAAKRYSFKGRVTSVDKNAATANIDNEPIAGFMDEMIMPYTIKPSSTLDQLQPGDSITADVVVEPDKYWLENVKVTGHSKPPVTSTTPGTS